MAAFVDEFFLADDKIDMYLYSDRRPGRVAAKASVDLPVIHPAGGVVPLSSIARVVETVDTSTVRRVDGRRTVTLNRSSRRERGAGKRRRDRARGRSCPPREPPARCPANGQRVDISGASDQLDATREALAGNYVVALILVYLVMVAIFHPLGLPAADHDDDPARGRRRHRRTRADERWLARYACRSSG